MIDPKTISESSSKRRGLGNIIKVAVGLMISAACIYLVLQKVSVEDLLTRLETVQWPFIGLAVVSLAVGYALRVLRWKIMLEAGSVKVRFLDCVPPFLGAITLNNILPLRSGDVLRAFVFPASIGVGRVLSLTSLIAERALDILVLCVAVIGGILLTSGYNYPGWVIPAVTVMGFGLLAGVLIVLLFGQGLSDLLSSWAAAPGQDKPSLRVKAARAVSESFAVFLQIATPAVAAKLVVVSVLSWLFEAGVFFAFFLSLGLPLFSPYSVIVMAVGTFSTLVPSSPGYVGPFHLAVSTLLVGYGLDPASATGYAVLVHLGLWVPTTVAGILCMAFNPGLFKAGFGKGNTSRRADS